MLKKFIICIYNCQFLYAIVGKLSPAYNVHENRHPNYGLDETHLWISHATDEDVGSHANCVQENIWTRM